MAKWLLIFATLLIGCGESLPQPCRDEAFFLGPSGKSWVTCWSSRATMNALGNGLFICRCPRQVQQVPSVELKSPVEGEVL